MSSKMQIKDLNRLPNHRAGVENRLRHQDTASIPLVVGDCVVGVVGVVLADVTTTVVNVVLVVPVGTDIFVAKYQRQGPNLTHSAHHQTYPYCLSLEHSVPCRYKHQHPCHPHRQACHYTAQSRICRPSLCQGTHDTRHKLCIFTKQTHEVRSTQAA